MVGTLKSKLTQPKSSTTRFPLYTVGTTLFQKDPFRPYPRMNSVVMAVGETHKTSLPSMNDSLVTSEANLALGEGGNCCSYSSLLSGVLCAQCQCQRQHPLKNGWLARRPQHRAPLSSPSYFCPANLAFYSVPRCKLRLLFPEFLDIGMEFVELGHSLKRGKAKA